MEKEHWESEAACKGMTKTFHDTIFFPKSNRSDRLAKRICADCPVRAQCGDTALRSPWMLGVWGGMSRADRERIWEGWRPSKDLVRRPGTMQL